MYLRIGLWRKQRAEELCFWTVVLEKTLESPLDCKEVQPVHPKDQSWVFIGRTDAKAETPILWPSHVKTWLIGKDWCWEGLGAGGEGDGSGWDGWMASQNQWTWVWVNSRSWWWTGRPGVLRFMGLQRVGHNWVTELNWTDFYRSTKILIFLQFQDETLNSPSISLFLLESAVVNIYRTINYELCALLSHRGLCIGLS